MKTSSNQKEFAQPMIGKKQRRGAAVVEFAILAPLMLGLLFGLIEIGQMVDSAQIATNASRDGARLAVKGRIDYPPPTPSIAPTKTQVKDWVEDYLQMAMGPGMQRSLTANPAATATENLWVEVEYDPGITGIFVDAPENLYDKNLVPAGTPLKVSVFIQFSKVSWSPIDYSQFLTWYGDHGHDAELFTIRGQTVMRKEN